MKKEINVLKFHCFRFCHNDTNRLGTPAIRFKQCAYDLCGVHQGFENAPNCKPPNFHFPGGYAIITMRAWYVTQDDDLSTLHTYIQQLVDERTVQVVEDRVFERFYNRSDGDAGLLLVLKKQNYQEQH